MKKKELDFILREGEGQYVEFKESLSDLARHFCAFANANGGKIFVGIDDQGRIKHKGGSVSNRLKAQALDIARHCDPKIDVVIKTMGPVMIINVKEGDNKPYQCKDGFFLRNGASTEKLKRDEILNFVVKEGRVRFDEIANLEFSVSKDVDKVKLARYRRLLAVASVNLSARDLLQSLDAAERHKGKLHIRNGAVMFFAKDPQRFFKDTYTTCVRYKGLDKEMVLDRQNIYGDLISQADEILKFIAKNTRLEYEFTGRPERVEKTEYPEAALREAIINALMHRDYFIEGAGVSVDIYDDRIEIANPGGLVKGMRMEDLGKRSVRRNRLIADLFHRVKLVEKIGSGIKRMRSLCLRAGSAPPQINVGGQWFEIVFRSRLAEIYGPVNGPVNDLVNGPINDRQQKILNYLSKAKKAAFKEIRSLFAGVSETTLKRDIAYLKKEKIIDYHGAPKKGYYMIIGK